MQIYETALLPKRCKECEELDCTTCDYALDRYYFDRLEELQLKVKAADMAIERFQKQKAELIAEIMRIEGKENEIDG